MNNFLKKANLKHNNNYDYSKVEYKNNSTKVSIICPEHGEFEQTPMAHLMCNVACPECYKIKVNKLKYEKSKENKAIFLEKAREKHNNKYDYSKVDYKNNSIKVTIICPEHGEFEQSPVAHIQANIPCPICYKIHKNTIIIEQSKENKVIFLKKANLKHNNKYDYSKVYYKNNSIKVTIICREHGEFLQAPAKHLSSQGCAKCSGSEKNIDKNRFIEKAFEKHGEKYEYTNVNYKDYSTKVEIYCPIHGIFKQSPVSHCSGKGCPKCGREIVENARRSNTEEFIQKAKAVHDDKYDYSKINYINNSTNITIICKEHGEFKQAPHNHLRGKGCWKCGRKVTENAHRSNTEEFIQKSRKVHGNQYDYSKVEYKSNSTNIIIICKDHGEFKQKPCNHLRGAGCSICSKSDRNITTEKCIERSIKVHGNKYDYSLVNYINSDTKINIICKKHGSFYQCPDKHWKGRGCFKCQCCPQCLLFQTNGRLCSYCKPRKNNKLYHKTKEYKVVEYMRTNIDKEFVHNKSVGDDCSKNDRENTNGHLYPDLRWDCGWFQLILEVDEYQHRGAEYNCDERRMMDIIAKLGMPCVFIRYNPDNKESNLEYLRIKIDEYLEEEEYVDNSYLDFGDFGLITEYLYYK